MATQSKAGIYASPQFKSGVSLKNYEQALKLAKNQKGDPLNLQDENEPLNGFFPSVCVTQKNTHKQLSRSITKKNGFGASQLTFDEIVKDQKFVYTIHSRGKDSHSSNLSDVRYIATVEYVNERATLVGDVQVIGQTEMNQTQVNQCMEWTLQDAENHVNSSIFRESFNKFKARSDVFSFGWGVYSVSDTSTYMIQTYLDVLRECVARGNKRYLSYFSVDTQDPIFVEDLIGNFEDILAGHLDELQNKTFSKPSAVSERVSQLNKLLDTFENVKGLMSSVNHNLEKSINETKEKWSKVLGQVQSKTKKTISKKAKAKKAKAPVKAPVAPVQAPAPVTPVQAPSMSIEEYFKNVKEAVASQGGYHIQAGHISSLTGVKNWEEVKSTMPPMDGYNLNLSQDGNVLTVTLKQ